MAWSDAARRAAALARKQRAKYAKYVTKSKEPGHYLTRVPGYSAGFVKGSYRDALNTVRSSIKAKRQFQQARRAGKSAVAPVFAGKRRIR